MRQELHKAGLKATKPRQSVLQILYNDPEAHLSADAIYQTLLKQGEDIGLATVYRVLTQFEQAGLVIKHNFEGDMSVFELNQGAHHDHLICVECGKVEEFVDDLIEERQQRIAQQANFRMTDHVLHIYGVCADCQSS